MDFFEHIKNENGNTKEFNQVWFEFAVFALFLVTISRFKAELNLEFVLPQTGHLACYEQSKQGETPCWKTHNLKSFAPKWCTLRALIRSFFCVNFLNVTVFKKSVLWKAFCPQIVYLTCFESVTFLKKISKHHCYLQKERILKGVLPPKCSPHVLCFCGNVQSLYPGFSQKSRNNWSLGYRKK